jgi:hypothetical protein
MRMMFRFDYDDGYPVGQRYHIWYTGPGIDTHGFPYERATSIDFREPVEERCSRNGNTVYKVAASNALRKFWIGDMLISHVYGWEKELLRRSILLPRRLEDYELLDPLERVVIDEFGIGTIFTHKGEGIVLPGWEKAEEGSKLAEYYARRSEIFPRRRQREGERRAFRRLLSEIIGRPWTWTLHPEEPKVGYCGMWGYCRNEYVVVKEMTSPDGEEVYVVRYIGCNDEDQECENEEGDDKGYRVMYHLVRKEEYQIALQQLQAELLEECKKMMAEIGIEKEVNQMTTFKELERLRDHLENLKRFKGLLGVEPDSWSLRGSLVDRRSEYGVTLMYDGNEVELERGGRHSTVGYGGGEAVSVDTAEHQMLTIIEERGEDPSAVKVFYFSLDDTAGNCMGVQHEEWADTFDFGGEVKPLLEGRAEVVKEQLLEQIEKIREEL